MQPVVDSSDLHLHECCSGWHLFTVCICSNNINIIVINCCWVSFLYYFYSLKLQRVQWTSNGFGLFIWRGTSHTTHRKKTDRDGVHQSHCNGIDLYRAGQNYRLLSFWKWGKSTFWSAFILRLCHTRNYKKHVFCVAILNKQQKFRVYNVSFLFGAIMQMKLRFYNYLYTLTSCSIRVVALSSFSSSVVAAKSSTAQCPSAKRTESQTDPSNGGETLEWGPPLS